MTSKATRAAQSGLFPVGKVAIANPPAIVATTVLFPNSAAMTPLTTEALSRSDAEIYDGFYYGGVGTPTTAALARAVAGLEGGAFAALAPSGQSATMAVLSALLKPGDHLLVVDTITYSARWYIDRRLIPAGIEVTYYDPLLDGDGIARLFRPNTRAVFMESPGSQTFEVQDVPAICAAAAAHGILTILDNTWAASLFFEPFRHGVDVALVSLSKCHAGPAGVALGALVTNSAPLYEAIRNETALLGLYVSPETCAAAATVLPSLALRVRHQEASALAVIASLAARSEVRRIMHPSRPGCPGHEIWRRDFTGANSLFSIEFGAGFSKRDVDAFADRLRLVRIGYGWGGAISLVSAFGANEFRTASRSPARGTCLRIYIGQEDPQDLVADFAAALDGMGRAGA